MNDRHTGPAWNVLMWTFLFLGQGIQVSLYCQEWYARRHCPLPQVRLQPLLVPLARQGTQQSALLGSDSFNSYGRGQGMAGGGDSCFRFIMCVTKSDLTNNLPFPDTADILGAGDTSLLVLPPLEVKASRCTDNGIKLFSTSKAQSQGSSLPHLESGTVQRGHRDSSTHLCGQLATRSVQFDSSTTLCGLCTGHLLILGSPGVGRLRGTGAIEVGHHWFCFSQCSNKILSLPFNSLTIC